MTEIAFAKPFFGKEESEAAAAAVASGWVVGGPRLAELEKGFAAQCGVAHAVGVSSWTTGAFLVLKSMGIGPGDEVIVPSLTFIASVNVIVHAGATPVFADIDPRTYNVDPVDIERKITKKTKAILPVDQIGMPCDIDPILEMAKPQNILVLQDAACSFGSYYKDKPIGGLAPVSVFSLHARKVITTGEGGMITLNNSELAARLRRLRHQGMSLSDFERHGASPTTFETYPEVGFNFRITDIQAAVGVEQLKRLPQILAARRVIADYYNAALKNHPWIVPPHEPDYALTNWQSYQIRLKPDAPITRNALMEALFTKGIPTRRGVMAAHHEQPYESKEISLPHTDAATAQCLQLPMHPALTLEQAERVILALNGCF